MFAEICFYLSTDIEKKMVLTDCDLVVIATKQNSR